MSDRKPNRAPGQHRSATKLGGFAANPPRARNVTERLPQVPVDRQILPADPSQALTAFAPPAEALVQLSAREQSPESAAVVSTQHPAARAYGELPADAPEWMRAARVMADSLEDCLARRDVDELERAAIERAWYAWTLGGATPRQVLRVAHLVRRAYEALNRSAHGDEEQSLRGCAEVLHNNLPTPVKQTIPLERALWVVRQMREQPDPWVAIVESTADLLGWKDYARVHAAYVIREVIKQA